MVLVEETVTYLEMTSADQLVPGRPPPAPLTMERLDPASLPLLRSTYARIGAPHRWVGRSAWSDAQWSAWLSRPGMQPWVARVDGEVAGMVELELQSGGDVEIVVFGLVPELVGRGFGSHLLTLGTRLAWEAEHPGKAPRDACGSTPPRATIPTPDRTTSGAGSARSGPSTGGGTSQGRSCGDGQALCVAWRDAAEPGLGGRRGRRRGSST
jgi:Acetyltransferase (GNAT) family